MQAAERERGLSHREAGTNPRDHPPQRLSRRDAYGVVLGNDSRWVGTPTVNLKDYGRTMSGEVGAGIAFLMPGQRDVFVEWSLPAAGFNELTRLLERIGHPRAAEFRAVADASHHHVIVVANGMPAEAGRRRRIEAVLH